MTGALMLRRPETRRRLWRRPQFAGADWRLIPIAGLATTAVAAFMVCVLQYSSVVSFVFLSVPLSYTANQNVAAAMPLPSPLPPPPPPSPRRLVPSRQSPFRRNASVFSPRPRDHVVPPPPGNATSRNGALEEAMQKGSRQSGPEIRPLNSLAPDEELAYAKTEIERAPLMPDDPDLYAPLFRNVSVFRRISLNVPKLLHDVRIIFRSYELMEKILKVYIYRDGDRPIFHTPPLKGIYASEGWFMKLMEENKQFTARDPSKAHLFYLPYSSRRLQEALYVPDSHNMRPLSLFLRDYVEKIAARYPFWNRTRGADHFLVACHDWGPYETTAHDELCKNAIKALCNADASEGIFVRGKDVSLPETSIRAPKRPLKYLGGRPVSQRPILAFFAGQMHGRVRPLLLEHWGGKDEDMKIYGPLPTRISRSMSYIQHMKSSRFCLCPMGFEVNSPRIVEAIYYECVPVIIADNFVPPFDEVLNWSAFSVVLAEKDIPDLKNALQGIPLRRYLAMQTNVKRLQRHFLWHAKPVKYDLFHMILHSIWFNRVNLIEAKGEREEKGET